MKYIPTLRFYEIMPDLIKGSIFAVDSKSTDCFGNISWPCVVDAYTIINEELRSQVVVLPDPYPRLERPAPDHVIKFIRDEYWDHSTPFVHKLERKRFFKIK